MLSLALQGAFPRAPDRRMNPESELVDERRREQGPSQLAAAVQQQVGRKLGLEPRDSVGCVAFEERRAPLERAAIRPGLAAVRDGISADAAPWRSPRYCERTAIERATNKGRCRLSHSTGRTWE